MTGSSAREREEGSADPEIDDFEPQRSYLRGLAYRMLGSRAEAEDVVQDAWLRWHAADRETVDRPRAFLARTVTRLCLDRLKSAQARREVYVGSWLPEPLVDEAERFTLPLATSPDAESGLAGDLSVAFLLALERLSPLERAAFLLHDVFDLGFAEIAEALGRSEAACRQLAARARAHVRERRPRFAVSKSESERLAAAFLGAVGQGDLAGLTRVLAEDATFISDGGGKVAAVPKPLIGRDRVARAILGFARLWGVAGSARVRPAWINGLAGFVLSTPEGAPIQTIALEPDADGRIGTIYVVRNPEKLVGVPP